MPAYIPYPYAFFEGKIVPIGQAQISIMTNSLHYGIGIYGGIKVYETPKGPAIFRLHDHLERMKNSVNILRFPYEFDVDKAGQTILELARKNQLTGVSYIRPIIYRADTELAPAIEGKYELAVYMMHMPDYFDAKKGLDVCVSGWQRNSDNTIPPRTKATGGYINSALAIFDAHASGYDSAIMLDKNGNVSEGAVMNIFLVKDGKLITPSADSDILEGITRKTIIELAKEMGIPLEQRHVKKSELYNAEEVFFTGTAANVTWCKSVDKKEISPEIGLITAKFSEAFEGLIKTHPQYFTQVAE